MLICGARACRRASVPEHGRVVRGGWSGAGARCETEGVTQTDAVRTRRGRPGYDRAEVLAVAVDLFNEQGYDATSVADLAQRLGVAKSALYHHFASKEELLASALDGALGALEAVLAEPGACAGSAGDRLRHVIGRAVLVLIAHLPEVTLLLRVRGNSAVELAALDRRRLFDHRVTVLVEAAQSAGACRRDIDAPTATRLVFGMVNSVAEWYRTGGPTDPGRLADEVLALVFDGLAAPDGAAVPAPFTN